jgi:hypothetical protein
MSRAPRSAHWRRSASAAVVGTGLAVVTACVAPQPPAPPPLGTTTTTQATTPTTATTTTSSVPGGTSGFSPTPRTAARLSGGIAWAMAQAGGVAYLGGEFTAINDGVTTLPRQHVAAVTEADGHPVTGFVADTDGVVDALAVVGNQLYLGGSFTTVNGVGRKDLARVDLATGAVDTSFALDANNVVYDLWLRGSRLYVSGDFTSLGGTGRSRVAAIDTTTGALVAAFKPTVDRRVSSVAASPDGSVVYLGGRFGAIDRQSVLNLAAVRAADGSLLSTRFADVQAPDPATTTSDILDLDVSPDGASLFVGIGGKHFNVVGAWNAATGARRWWHGFDATDHLDGDVQGIVYDGGKLYFGFHGGYNGDNTRRLMVADAASGVLDAGFQPKMNGTFGVTDVGVDSSVLVAAGDFTVASGVPLGGVGLFPRLP